MDDFNSDKDIHVRQSDFDQQDSSSKSIKDGVKKRFLIALGVIGGFGVMLLIYLLTLMGDLPSLTQLENFDPELISRIYSADGVVIKELYTQRRVLIPLEKIPPYMVDALIATEDQQFYKHWGMNVNRTIKALMVDILSFSFEQGASTVTQQLARNLYESIGFRKTIVRKIKEAITAIQIERTYTKDEVLEMYLNSIYFGRGVYGIQAAASIYYAKDAEDLTLDEAATLVGLLRRPRYYNPMQNPENAFNRRNVVLSLMHDQGYISRPVMGHYSTLAIRTFDSQNDGGGIAPYFSEYIRRRLEEDSEALGIDPYRDGLNIHTTLDSRLQTAANAAYEQYMQVQQGELNTRLLSSRERLANTVDTTLFSVDTLHQMLRGMAPVDSSLRSKLVVQGALVSLDPSTGEILAMIGGRDFNLTKFNRATQARRQPGSVFKPFLYTSAIDNGVPVTRQLLNQPVVLQVDDTTRWTPQNYDRSTGGLISLREGLRRSLNLISVRLVQEVVPPTTVAQYAHRMGISTPIRAVDAIALGTSEVIPIEVTAAYSTFANHGIWNEPVGISRITDRYGNVIKEYIPMKREVLSEETAYIMTDMLRTVLKQGTGRSAVYYGFDRPGGGKTGTTQNFTDAWFVGFTPQIATGVWVGVDDPSVSLGQSRSGAVAALPMWATYMSTAHDTLNLPEKEFQQPEGVVEMTICAVSKDLPTDYCPTETEIFNSNYLPTDECEIHGRFNVEDNQQQRRTF